MGPNGSDKTTLIKILNGLLTPTEGTIMIDGNYGGPATKSKVAYLPDRIYLTMNQTIREILDFFQTLCGLFQRTGRRDVKESGNRSFGEDADLIQRYEGEGTADSCHEPECQPVYFG